YSELQWWPGKEPAQVYAEVLEQIENADRLGFDAYAAIEHFFFPKFSASPDPIALFSAAAQRTSRINFRTLVHVLPYHNPMVLASRIAHADVLLGGRYEFGVGRGHGWIPWRAARTGRCASGSSCTAQPAPSTGTSRTSSGSTPATSTRTATRRSGRPRRE